MLSLRCLIKTPAIFINPPIISLFLTVIVCACVSVQQDYTVDYL